MRRNVRVRGIHIKELDLDRLARALWAAVQVREAEKAPQPAEATREQ